jgi:phosphatidate cytidylyltransferase
MLARVLTAVVGIPLLVFAALSESAWVVGALTVALVVLCGLEVYHAEKLRLGSGFLILLTIVGGGCLLAAWDPAVSRSAGVIVSLPAVLSLIVLAGIWLRRGVVVGAFVPWVAVPLLCLPIIRRFDLATTGSSLSLAQGSALLLLFLCLWSGDTAAFLVGKSMGRHKLAPSVSPNKTWEGAAANLAASCATGWFAATWNGLTPQTGLCVGFVVGIFGQVGDLYESAWKRSLGIKDSGALLPGHGGVLDRFDSLLFAAPPVALLLYAGLP